MPKTKSLSQKSTLWLHNKNPAQRVLLVVGLFLFVAVGGILAYQTYASSNLLRKWGHDVGDTCWSTCQGRNGTYTYEHSSGKRVSVEVYELYRDEEVTPTFYDWTLAENNLTIRVCVKAISTGAYNVGNLYVHSNTPMSGSSARMDFHKGIWETICKDMNWRRKSTGNFARAEISLKNGTFNGIDIEYVSIQTL